jgi:dTDP-4-amino-4,6-dideoxygalactose transaminase
MASEPTIPAARVVFSAQDRREIASLVDGALQSGSLTLGEHTRALESAFASAHRVPYAVAVSSGTAALEIVLRAVDVAGREVVVPANTFAATAFAVLAAGGVPVFADVDVATGCVSASTVADALTERTAGVVVVHIAGTIPSDIATVRELCDERGIALVEDAAHAVGCAFDGRPAGSFGVAAAFSFYPTKVITSGEGGMIVTADERLRDEALVHRDQGKASFGGNVHTRRGYAWRMSELHAAVGVVHLRHLEEFAALRRRVAARYTDGLASIPALAPLAADPRLLTNVYKYAALLDDGLDRAAVKSAMRERGVALSGEVYETPLHQQPVFAELARGSLPGAERFCARHVCLPVHSDMTDAEADRVLSALAEVVG